MRKAFKRAVGAGVLAGIGYAAWRAWQAQRPARREVEWSSAPFPFPPVPRPATQPTRPNESSASSAGPSTEPAGPSTEPAGPSTQPAADGSCPVTHPVKGKRQSGIYHVPGGANYARTHADRCYVDEDAAERDGLRRSKV